VEQQPLDTSGLSNKNTTQNSSVEQSAYQEISKNYTAKTWSEDNIQAFSSKAISLPTFNLGHIIKNTIIILISGFPLVILCISIASFLIDNSFDITRLGNYPSWATLKLEEFVKTTIMPLTK